MADNYLHQSTDEIEYLKITMLRPNMDGINLYPLPPKYSFHLYKPNSNDDRKWAEIATAAGEFRTVEQGQAYFRNTFMADENAHLLPERLYFLVNPEGKYIGQALAWQEQVDGEELGALNWVAIIPEYQGKKLAKPLVSIVLKKISEYSNKCFLPSQTSSWRAINMYDDLGFKPNIKTENSEKAWKLLSKLCNKQFI